MGFQENIGVMFLSLLFVAAWVVAVEMVPEHPNCPDQEPTETIPAPVFTLESVCGYQDQKNHVI